MSEKIANRKLSIRSRIEKRLIMSVLTWTIFLVASLECQSLKTQSTMTMAAKSIRTQSVETGLKKRGFKFVIGSDEAGRGCIAGPVVVASCCCVVTPDFQPIEGVDDSKNLNEADRNRIYEHIIFQPDNYLWSVALSSNVDIAESNILKATMNAFRESIETIVKQHQLPFNSTYSIVDGNKTPKLSIPVPCRPWVSGDATVYTVALASVIAKVTRDRIMTKASDLYPAYGFDIHKGYPTRDHIVAIHAHGPSPLHRMSFKPLKGR